MNRFNQWLSIKLAKRPGTVVLGAILLFNIVFFLISVLVFKNLNLKGTEEYGFFEAAYLTITMILDAGCISYVIDDIGKAGIATAVICLVIIFIGMISFTGAVIGYITNYISNFLEKADSGYRRLKISDHIVILNWNTRASEIINDLLYCKENQNVVVLVSSGKERVEKEISERLSETIALNVEQRKNNKNISKLCKVNVVVREGDVFSTKQLNDISLDQARSVVILGNDVNNSVCKFETMERLESRDNGNTLTVKTLMQVADITSAQTSANDQKIIVEITDDWTEQLVDEVIKSKEVHGKCNIVPVKVNQVLGQLLSQFSITPELNGVYSELFSNQGAIFCSCETDETDEVKFISEFLSKNKLAIPITIGESQGKKYKYFSTDYVQNIFKDESVKKSDIKVSLNKDYWLEKRHVIILGHNSNIRYIMKGFESFCDEWSRNGESIIDTVVVDNKASLEKMNYYRDYPFVEKYIECDVYDKAVICDAINDFVSQHTEDTSILILSDDGAIKDDIDANALASLIYVQDIISQKKKENPDFDVASMDVIVELIDPKHHDIVNHYSGYNVVISNRYISKMITQLGENDSLFEFYQDILSFDGFVDGQMYESKEIYAKKVSHFFNKIPDEMTAAELIRAVWDASSSDEYDNPTIVLGYVTSSCEIVLFEGDQDNIRVKFSEKDKIIVFTAH